jgi:hypothetical protein
MDWQDFVVSKQSMAFAILSDPHITESCHARPLLAVIKPSYTTDNHEMEPVIHWVTISAQLGRKQVS